nr:hypothetical protein [uncultured Sphingorhabdus sp.]
MTNLTEAPMAQHDEDTPSNGKRILWIIGASLGLVMTAGAITGFLSQMKVQGDDSLNGAAVAVLITFAAIIIGLAYVIWNLLTKMRLSGEKVPRRERLNRNIILACGGIGGVVGIAIAATGIANAPNNGTDPFSSLLTGPIPLNIVVPLIFVWGVIMPMVAWFWHTRVIDEQEANAYKDGGYYAGYAFLMLTPLWWLLWRGGLVSEPNGVAIYFTFSIVWSVVWFWKKYR